MAEHYIYMVGNGRFNALINAQQCGLFRSGNTNVGHSMMQNVHYLLKETGTFICVHTLSYIVYVCTYVTLCGNGGRLKSCSKCAIPNLYALMKQTTI